MASPIQIRKQDDIYEDSFGFISWWPSKYLNIRESCNPSGTGHILRLCFLLLSRLCNFNKWKKVTWPRKTCPSCAVIFLASKICIQLKKCILLSLYVLLFLDVTSVSYLLFCFRPGSVLWTGLLLSNSSYSRNMQVLWLIYNCPSHLHISHQCQPMMNTITVILGCMSVRPGDVAKTFDLSFSSHNIVTAFWIKYFCLYCPGEIVT